MAAEKQRGLADGKPGESLFHRSFINLGRENELPELFKKVEGMNDDRLLAITSALIVENRIDKMLAAFLPGYSRQLESNADFSFSMKISLLKALNFIPPLILSAADCIRKTRNEFAHQLKKTAFSHINMSILNGLEGIVSDAYRGVTTSPPIPPPASARDRFERLTFFCVVSLDCYIVNVEALRKSISEPSFAEGLELATRQRNSQ